MRRNHRGFTLVEVIVVVSILSALTGIISLSVSSVFSVRVRRCATEINAFISMCKVNSMSRGGDIRIVLDVDDNGGIRGRYYEDGSPGAEPKSTEIFSDANVSAEFTVGGVTTALSSDNPLTLSFDRSTGGFKPCAMAGTEKIYCTSISVTGGKTYVITLVPSTGNHYMG